MSEIGRYLEHENLSRIIVTVKNRANGKKCSFLGKYLDLEHVLDNNYYNDGQWRNSMGKFKKQIPVVIKLKIALFGGPAYYFLRCKKS